MSRILISLLIASTMGLAGCEVHEYVHHDAPPGRDLIVLPSAPAPCPPKPRPVVILPSPIIVVPDRDHPHHPHHSR